MLTRIRRRDLLTKDRTVRSRPRQLGMELLERRLQLTGHGGLVEAVGLSGPATGIPGDANLDGSFDLLDLLHRFGSLARPSATRPCPEPGIGYRMDDGFVFHVWPSRYPEANAGGNLWGA